MTSYLFQDAIMPALNVEATFGNANYLKGESEKVTAALVVSNPRHVNIHDDYQHAEELIAAMGGQFKSKNVGDDWAGNYVSEWRMVSGNAGIIRSMVSAELYRAYRIGLDIRSTQVLGQMFKLAVLVWSILGEYSSPSQNEGRR